MTTLFDQIKAEKTNVFIAKNKKSFETPQKTATYLEAALKNYDFGYYVKTCQSKFKKSLIEHTTKKVDIALNNYTMGLITNKEKDNLMVDIWLHANCCLHHFILHDCTHEQGPYNYNHKSQKKATKQPERKRYVMAERF
jgi:hypothetical protein